MAKDDTYSIKEMIAEFREDTSKSLHRIETQTVKTNGRVTSLEKSRIQMWTAVSIILLLGGTIVTLVIMAIDGKIQKAITQALKDNVTQIEYAE